MAKIMNFFVAPKFEDAEKTRVARILNAILIATIVLVGILTVIRVIDGGQGTATAVINLTLVGLAIVLQVVMRLGYVRVASIVLVGGSWLLLLYQARHADGVHDTAFIALIVIILLTNLLLGWKAGLLMVLLTILSGWGLAYIAEQQGGLESVDFDPPFSVALDLTVVFGMAAVVLAITTGSLSSALKRAKDSETSLEKSNRELQELSHSLEEQVAARTRRLEFSAALAERLNAILNLDALLTEVVNQIKTNFDYYYAHIYLVDKNNEKLVVAAGTGEAGAVMKSQEHSIKLDNLVSVVARAARRGQVVRVDNVNNEPDWLQNPLLPDTQSEMAVPVFLDGKVVGVLDVQSANILGFDDSDASVLRSLANQVAVAIRNARLFEEVETALTQAQAAQERYVEQAWSKTETTSNHSEYHYARSDASALTDVVVEQADKLAAVQNHVTLVNLQNDTADKAEAKTIVAPVVFRNQTIGALQIYPSDNDQNWNDEDIAIVEAVVDQLAQTAESLRLFEETRSRAGREQTIREITNELRSASNMEQLAAIAARELNQRLGGAYTGLSLGIESQTSFENGDQDKLQTS